MAHMEIDPLLRRGIRLMLSKAPDALEQLKALAEEAVIAKQRNSSGKLGCNTQDLRRDSPVARSRHSSPSPNTLATAGNRDVKREHHLQEEAGLPLVPPSKRSRLTENPLSAAPPHTPSPTPSLKSDGGSSRGGSRRSDESDQEADINDIAMEITSGISCTVCKRISFYSVNQLVECQECHLIYHQDCHKPAISKADITDPRRVWYCAKCTRNMRKQTSAGGTTNSSSSGVGSSTRSSSSANKSSGSRHAAPSPSKSSSSHASSPSKSSSSLSSSSSSARQSPFTNLTAVTTRAAIGSDRSSSSTASSTRESKASSTTASSNSSSRGGGDSKGSSAALPNAAPSNSMLSAERRMHIMKKKAAAKMAERRKI